MLKRILLFSILFVFIVPLSRAANSLDAVRIVEHADKTRIVFDLAKKPVFNVYDKYKKTQIVVDFAHTKNKINYRALASKSSNIRTVSLQHTNKKSDIRLTFSLAKAIKYRYFELAKNKHSKYRLVIDLPAKPSKLVTKSVAKPAIKKYTKPKAIIPKPQLRDVVIAIDAGHGGKDPGSIGFKRFVEKDINLAIAKKTVRILNNKKGIKAVLIRKTDKYISLNKRSEIARKYKAELLVSIHSDGFTSSKPSGASTLILSNGRAKYEKGKKLKANNLDGLLGGVGDAIKNSEQTDDLQRTFLDLGQQYSLSTGNDVAQSVHNELSRVTKMHKSKPVEQSLAVLKSVDIPSLLVEAGFVTNYKEGKRLTTRAHQQKIANAIAQGVYKHFRKSPPMNTYLANINSTLYIVKKGDSLSKIAQTYGVNISRLKQFNNLTADQVNIGQKIKIPTS